MDVALGGVVQGLGDTCCSGNVVVGVTGSWGMTGDTCCSVDVVVGVTGSWDMIVVL